MGNTFYQQLTSGKGKEFQDIELISKHHSALPELIMLLPMENMNCTKSVNRFTIRSILNLN